MFPLLPKCTHQKTNLRADRALQEETFDGTFLLGVRDFNDGRKEDPFPAVQTDDGRIFDIENIDKIWVRNMDKRSGLDRIKFRGTRSPGGKVRANSKPDVFRGQGSGRRNGKRGGRRLATTGIQKVLAVRAIAPDASTTSSAQVISDEIFGTSTDSVNLRSQYQDCSYNQLDFQPTTDFGTGTSVGTTTVNISANVSGASDSDIRTAMLNALGGKPANVDYVMLCVPPGTSGGWIAYAYINSYLSVYNNEWCNYPSGQMHEVSIFQSVLGSSKLLAVSNRFIPRLVIQFAFCQLLTFLCILVITNVNSSSDPRLVTISALATLGRVIPTTIRPE